MKPHLRYQRNGLGWPRFLGRLVDQVLERQCALCAMPLEPGGSPSGFCTACLDTLPGAGAPRCPGCALYQPRAELCPSCSNRSAQHTPTLVCCDYAPPVDRLVTAFKYGRRFALGRAIGALMAQQLHASRQARPPGPECALLPIPIAPSRLASRGFDQAALLAHQIAARNQLPVASAGLRRVRETRAQPGLPRSKRQDNLYQAMHGSPALATRLLILVDDVITTGATMREAERAVLAAGGRPILRLAFARTPGAPEQD